MYNPIIIKTQDPINEFNGIWLNKESGALFVWADKPVLIGFAKDGHLLKVDNFSAEFEYTEKRNEQEYSITYEYGKVPLLILAKIENYIYQGSDISINLGGEYGCLSPQDKFVIVAQNGNVEIGSDLTIECEPTAGKISIVLTVISYE